MLSMRSSCDPHIGIKSAMLIIFVFNVLSIYSASSYIEIKASSNACYDARSRMFNNCTGEHDEIFYAPRNGSIEGIKLVHNSGGVQCSAYFTPSNWGLCSRLGIVIMSVTDPINYVGNMLYPVNGKTDDVNGWTKWNYPILDEYVTQTLPNSYSLAGYNENSDYLLFINPIYNITTMDQFMLQYIEGYAQLSAIDNVGVGYATVYFLYSTPKPTTYSSSKPTIFPTQSPTYQPTLEHKSSSNRSTRYWVFLLAVFVLIICCLCSLYQLYVKRKSESNQDTDKKEPLCKNNNNKDGKKLNAVKHHIGIPLTKQISLVSSDSSYDDEPHNDIANDPQNDGLIPVQSLKQIYVYLKDEEGINMLQKTVEEWEYDYISLRNDVNGEQKLKDKIQEPLYDKLRLLINADECHQRLIGELIKYNGTNKNIDALDINHFNQLLEDHHKLLQDHSIIHKSLYCYFKQCPIFQRNHRNVMETTCDQLSNNIAPTHAVKYDTYSARIAVLDALHCFWCHSNNLEADQNRMCRKYNQLYDDKVKTQEMYIFGSYFNYGDDLDEERKSNDDNCIVVALKYKDLKEEVTKNEIWRLTEEQYNNEYAKAQLFFDSPHRKQYYTYIKEEHLLALMIYCNFDHFSYEFSKTYREFNGEKHSNFYHLGKLLKQSVLKHGTSIKDGTKKEFYHGVSQRLVPKEIVGDLGRGISIFCPLSTSTSKAVALRFSNDEGIVMTFSGKRSEAKYFSVRWLSNFPHEFEHLFLQNKHEVQIQNIIECANSEEYEFILNALKLFDSILCDNYPFEDEERLILKMCNHQLSINLKNEKWKSFESLRKYGRELISVYFRNKQSLTINYLVLQQKYSDLFSIICLKNHNWINIDILHALFPNISCIWVKNINLCDRTMKYILNDLKDRSLFCNKSDTWNLKQMFIKAVKLKDSKMKAAVKKYKERFNALKIEIEHVDHLDKFETILFTPL